ncbi:MAG: hypothetical protein K0B00_04835 [Rhodobacteraceae bacterium]|nr:hypothetical protein [Paracoccaceae bacterium]
MEHVTGLEPLNAAETQLVAACVAGEPCVLGDGSRPEGPSLTAPSAPICCGS